MNQLNLSIEELIFSLYSEGYFEQGMSLKEAYFPDLEDEKLGFLFEIACRSLLAKEVLEFRDRQYRYKPTFRHFIQAMNDAEYTVKASKFGSEGEEEAVSFHVTRANVYCHEMLYDKQVHRIQKIQGINTIYNKVHAFLHMHVSTKRSVILSLNADEFEALLEGASEKPEALHSFLEKHKDQEKVKQFARDLWKRKGKMDSLMKVIYDKENMPDVQGMVFIIPGKEHSWVVSGMNRNEFHIETAHADGLQSIF
ncbi:hypothetical protein [Bacillus sp. NPDC077027]|uniref:hypothetical protein n=1 Tax=Bacillus sp. NPDC077027 TaxID=3390548 RepID=UPI003CFEA86B